VSHWSRRYSRKWSIASATISSRVRVHSGAAAEHSTRRLNANAYTVGNNIVFGAGQFAPNTFKGRWLLAHELTHAVQQSGADGGNSNKPRDALPISKSAITIQRDTPKNPEEQPGRNRKTAAGGSKALSKGVIIWGMSYESRGEATVAVVQIIFTPYKPYRGKNITFLQTVLRTKSEDADPTKRASIDILTRGREGADRDDTDPFYDENWDNKSATWGAEGAPSGFRNQPGGESDPNAYLYDEPFVFPGQVKMFETVAVLPETTETLGAIRWGVQGGDDGVKVLCLIKIRTSATHRPPDFWWPSIGSTTSLRLLARIPTVTVRSATTQSSTTSPPTTGRRHGRLRY
jgi:Domain of unknown function (DUF4157)